MLPTKQTSGTPNRGWLSCSKERGYCGQASHSAKGRSFWQIFTWLEVNLSWVARKLFFVKWKPPPSILYNNIPENTTVDLVLPAYRHVFLFLFCSVCLPPGTHSQLHHSWLYYKISFGEDMRNSSPPAIHFCSLVKWIHFFDAITSWRGSKSAVGVVVLNVKQEGKQRHFHRTSWVGWVE